MALAIALCVDARIVLDVLREARPFSPDDVVQEFADVLRRYGFAEVRATATQASGRQSASRGTGSATDRPRRPRAISIAPCCYE